MEKVNAMLVIIILIASVAGVLVTLHFLQRIIDTDKFLSNSKWECINYVESFGNGTCLTERILTGVISESSCTPAYAGKGIYCARYILTAGDKGYRANASTLGAVRDANG